jgi:hypothetical protein
LQLVVTGVEVPLVSIDCISCRENNLFYISNSSILKLIGSCSNCGILTSYKWRVIDQTGSPLELDSSTTTTGANRPNLVLKRNVLNNNYTYVFELTATSLLYDASGTARMFMNAALPPSGGSCLYIGPTHVTALKDILTVLCFRWKSNSYTSDALQYNIYAVDPSECKNKNNKVRLADYTITTEGTQLSADEWGSYPVYRGIQQKTSFFLAPFNHERGEVILNVEIVDSRGIGTMALEQ